MDTSVGTKVRKKQPSLSGSPADIRLLEPYLLSLENACMRVLETEYTQTSHDTEQQYWQQKLMNIAKPISLALAECNGLRRFHNHYRHRADDETVLHPVLEPSPLIMLAQVCEEAIKTCHNTLVGIQESALLKLRSLLENALQEFLLRYKNG